MFSAYFSAYLVLIPAWFSAYFGGHFSAYPPPPRIDEGGIWCAVSGCGGDAARCVRSRGGTLLADRHRGPAAHPVSERGRPGGVPRGRGLDS